MNRTALLVFALAASISTPALAQKAPVAKPKASKSVRTKARVFGKTRVKTPTRARLGSRLSARLFARRTKTRDLPKRQQESKLSHALSPYRTGQTRTWKVSANGQVSKMTETVAKTKVEGKQLQAEVHYSNGSAKWTAVTQTVGGEVMVSQLAKIGDAPAKGVTVYGVALPRRLKPGKSWTNIVTQEGSSRQTEYKVVKAITMKDPNGITRKGFEVAIKDTSRVRVDGKITNEVKSSGRYRVLEGVGMVWAQNTVNGSTVTNQLVSFTE